MSTTESSAKASAVGPASGSEQQLLCPSRFPRQPLACRGRSLVIELIQQAVSERTSSFDCLAKRAPCGQHINVAQQSLCRDGVTEDFFLNHQRNNASEIP